MKKGQVLEGLVERVEFPNKGIVHVGDDTCIVKNSLPGQKIRFSVNKIKKGKAEGRLLEVLEKAPAECDVLCSFFGVCGGCVYLSLPYAEQLKMKEAQVKRLLDSVLPPGYCFEGILGSPVQSEYRNKMEFSFGDAWKGGPLTLGMHKRGSFYDVVFAGECRLVDEDYRRILTAALAYFSERGIPYLHRMSHEGYLRHLLVRKAAGTGEILAALVTTSQTEALPIPEKKLMDGFTERLRALSLQGSLQGVLQIVNDSVADVIKSEETRILFGRDYFYEGLLGLRFCITPFSFFQTNTLGAEVLYSTVRDYVGGLRGKDGTQDKVVYDLYSGTGTIAQLMAPVAGKVIGVEIVEEAVRAATENAALNGLDNCEFIAGDVLQVLDEIAQKPDCIILDPPRDGIHPRALPKIVAYGVERLVYISCKPTSLVRDLPYFLQNGYHVERSVCIDQFPQTANIETVCLLSKKP